MSWLLIWRFVQRKKNLDAIFFENLMQNKLRIFLFLDKCVCYKILWVLRLTNDSDMIQILSNYSVCRLFLYQNFGSMSKISVIFLPKQHFNLDMTQSWERSIFFHMMMLRSAFQDIKANHTYVRIPTKKTRLKYLKSRKKSFKSVICTTNLDIKLKKYCKVRTMIEAMSLSDPVKLTGFA